MIRRFTPNDMSRVLDIWLSASMKAHDFIDAEFWLSQVSAMRDIYIPLSQVYIYEEKSGVAGFYALHEDKLAAIFVAPDKQGKGIGKSLIEHAKTQRERMTLTVYKSNSASVEFYLSQGFLIVGQSRDENTGHAEYIMSFRNEKNR